MIPTSYFTLCFIDFDVVKDDDGLSFYLNGKINARNFDEIGSYASGVSAGR